MKTRNQLITSAFALMMVFVLLLSSTAVMAGSGFEALAPGSPTGPEPVVTITSPAANSYNNTGSVTAKWTVAPNQTAEFAHIWNHTKITKVGGADGAWINKTSANGLIKWNNHTFSGLTAGQYIVTVVAVYWNNTAVAYQNGTKTVLITVDLVKPTLAITNPVDGSRTNRTNFTATWTVDGTGSPVATITGFMKNVTDNKVYGVKTVTGKTSQWITNFTDKQVLKVGRWNLTMQVTDSAGNVATAWSNFTVQPYVTITKPTQYMSATDFNVTWTPNLITGAGVATYDIVIKNVTDGVWFAPANEPTFNNVWLKNVTDGFFVADGKAYLLWVNVTQGSGPTYYGNTSLAFVVDTSKPTVFWVTPREATPKKILNNNTGTVQWSALSNGLAPIVNSSVFINNTVTMKWLNVAGTTNTTTVNAVWGSALPDGVYTMKVVVYDGAGNTGRAFTNFTMDATAPAITIANPATGSYTKLNNFTASWSIAETGTGLVKSWARLVNVSGSHNYSWVDVTGKNSQWITNFSKKTLLAEGTWLLQMAATDVAGNNGTKISTFTVDQTVPTGTINVPGAYTNKGNFTASWTASGTGSPVDFYRVRLVSPVGASPGWSGNIVASSAWITNFTVGKANLTEGNWTMYLFVQDMAGNNATVSKVFMVDLTKPLVVVLFPVADGNGVATKDVNVTWDGSDALAGIDHYNVSIDGTWTVLGNVKYHVFVSLSEGSHTVGVVAFDKAGNTQTASRTFIVDVTKPSVAITFPAMGQYFKVDTVNATWTMSDVNLDRAEVSLDGAAYASVGLNNWSVMSALVDGEHTFSVIAYDIAGNWNETNVTFFVDKVSPVVVILNPVDGGYYNVTGVIAAWLGVDPTPSSGIAYYESQLDSEGWQFMGATTVRPLTLTEGVHTFSVRAFDNATNNFTTSVSFVIDLTKPDVSVLFPSEGMMFASTDVFMNWTASDGQTDIASYEIMIDDGVWMPMALVAEYTFTGLADGTHLVYVKAFDLAGNYNVTSVSFVTDVTSPYVVIVVPADAAQFSVDSVFVEWTAVDNTTGLWFWWAWVDDDAPVNVTGLLNTTFSGLSEGNHVIHVKAWDLVGNAQEKSVSILTDLSAPNVDITSPANLAHLASRTVTVNFDVTDTYSGVKEIWVKLESSADWTSVGLAATYTFTVVSDTSTTPYTFLVKAQDNVGNEATSQVQFFVDTAAPSLVSHVPATGANGVLRNAQVVVDFSEEMLASSLSITLSPAVSGTYLWNSAHTQVIFTPSANMAFATVYTANVAGTDLAGNALTGTLSWTFTTIAHVTGVVRDVNGNPIANATINMTQGANYWVTNSDANGNFAIDVPVGTYNLTISASGQKDTVRNDVAIGTGTNDLGDVGMSPVDDWTWVIVAVVIIVAALLVLLYLRSKGKLGKKPEEPKDETKPAEKK
jgi:hypothetical protein